jgi:hypothetical protein
MVFWGVNFCNLVRKQKEGEKGAKGFLLEKNGPNHHTTREKNLKLPYLENNFQQFTKTKSIGNPFYKK